MATTHRPDQMHLGVMSALPSRQEGRQKTAVTGLCHHIRHSRIEVELADGVADGLPCLARLEVILEVGSLEVDGRQLSVAASIDHGVCEVEIILAAGLPVELHERGLHLGMAAVAGLGEPRDDEVRPRGGYVHQAGSSRAVQRHCGLKEMSTAVQLVAPREVRPCAAAPDVPDHELR